MIVVDRDREKDEGIIEVRITGMGDDLVVSWRRSLVLPKSTWIADIVIGAITYTFIARREQENGAPIGTPPIRPPQDRRAGRRRIRRRRRFWSLRLRQWPREKFQWLPGRTFPVLETTRLIAKYMVDLLAHRANVEKARRKKASQGLRFEGVHIPGNQLIIQGRKKVATIEISLSLNGDYRDREPSVFRGTTWTGTELHALMSSCGDLDRLLFIARALELADAGEQDVADELISYARMAWGKRTGKMQEALDLAIATHKGKEETIHTEEERRSQLPLWRAMLGDPVTREDGRRAVDEGCPNEIAGSIDGT